MKIKSGYVIRQVMGNYVVIATGEESRGFHGMVKLNETAANIWSYISEGKSEEAQATGLSGFRRRRRKVPKPKDTLSLMSHLL